MPQVIYRPSDGLVMRVLRHDDEEYTKGLPFSLVVVGIPGNVQLLLDISAAPDNFAYDGPNTKFIETTGGGPVDRPISSRKSDAAAAFLAEVPSLATTLAAVGAITDIASARVVLTKIVKAIYAIYEYEGIRGD